MIALVIIKLLPIENPVAPLRITAQLLICTGGFDKAEVNYLGR